MGGYRMSCSQKRSNNYLRFPVAVPLPSQNSHNYKDSKREETYEGKWNLSLSDCISNAIYEHIEA